jgi:hypothetical protein
MKIKQFQELYFISQSQTVDFDKSIKMVGAITGRTPDQVDKMPMRKFTNLCKRINLQFQIFGKDLMKQQPRKFVFVKGRLYRLEYELNRINAGKYVEALAFSKDVINNLHKLMATIATPVKLKGFKLVPYEREHSKIAADFEHLNFATAYHSAVFFYTFYKTSMEIIQPYLVKEAVKKGANKEQTEQTLQDFLTISDGFLMPKWSQNLRAYALTRFGN